MAGNEIRNDTLALGLLAAKQGDVEKLRTWLSDGNDPNQQDAQGWTALLWAAVRGHVDAVALLLENPYRCADATLAHGRSGALPIHFAGHCGSVAVAQALLDKHPEQLDAVWDLNGHGVLMQAVFYGHLALAGAMLERGASTVITTARGLGPMEMAMQFQNHAMMDLLRPHDASAQAKADYYQQYLQRIAVDVPPEEKAQQALSDTLIKTLETGIRRAFTEASAVQETLDLVSHLVEQQGADVNRLGGPLGQPALIVVATGNNGEPTNPNVASLRNRLAAYLLDHGADPALHERHPMGVQAIIRACVFNHLDILQHCSRCMGTKALADALNEIPIANGLTALHDTVLRTTMAGPDRLENYLLQTQWAVAAGARSDIEDFAGRTQRNLAEAATDPALRERLLNILQ